MYQRMTLRGVQIGGWQNMYQRMRGVQTSEERTKMRGNQEHAAEFFIGCASPAKKM